MLFCLQKELGSCLRERIKFLFYLKLFDTFKSLMNRIGLFKKKIVNHSCYGCLLLLFSRLGTVTVNEGNTIPARDNGSFSPCM